MYTISLYKNSFHFCLIMQLIHKYILMNSKIQSKTHPWFFPPV